MFAFFALYLDGKIVLVLCQRKEKPESNGVWVATVYEHLDSLRILIPALQPLSLTAKTSKDSHWQFIPEESPDFEQSVIKVCDLIKAHDPRIGKIPLTKKKLKTS